MDFYHDEHYRLIRKHTIAEDCHGRKASIQYKLVGTLFRVLRVNKMLDKEGPEFEKLLETYRIKQKKPLAVPYKRMDDFDIITKTVEGMTVYVVRKKGAMPQKAVLYLFVRNTFRHCGKERGSGSWIYQYSKDQHDGREQSKGCVLRLRA